MLESFLFKVPDHRRKQGRRYPLGHILLFTILALLSGADSYRKVQKFIVVHYDRLNDIFELIGRECQPIPPFGTSFKAHQAQSWISAVLAENDDEKLFIGCDGKVLRGSFDHFQDQKAVQILEELGLSGYIFTFDALHCQKNASNG